MQQCNLELHLVWEIERFFKLIFLHIKTPLPVIIYIYDIEK